MAKNANLNEFATSAGNSSQSVVTLMYLRWEHYLHGPTGSVTHEASRAGCWRRIPVQDSDWTELSWSLVCCYQECLWMNFPLFWESHIPVTSHFSLKRFCNWGRIWSLVSSQSLLSVEAESQWDPESKAGREGMPSERHTWYVCRDGWGEQGAKWRTTSFFPGRVNRWEGRCVGWMDGDKVSESLVISISFFANYEYKKSSPYTKKYQWGSNGIMGK